MRIGFIGAGKVGTNLARYFYSKNFAIAGFYSNHFEQAVESSQKTKSQAFTSLAECVKASDWLFLTVPDDCLAAVWFEVEPLISNEQFIFHCSGAKSASIFTTKKASSCFSLHPLLAFANKEMPLELIAEAPFTLEGSKNLKYVEKILASLNNPLAVIASEEKVRYHAACVFASNLVVGLAATAEEVLLNCGLPEEFAQNAWRQLFLQNTQNLLAMSPSETLTGPVERNDLSTVSDHLATLTGEEAAIYRALTKKLLHIAAANHPERDYQVMERMLNQ